MLRILRRVGLLAVLLASLTHADLAAARAYDTQTMLSLQAYGDAVTLPGGRFVLLERRRRYDDGGAYDYGYFSRWSLSNIFVVDFAHPGGPRALFNQSRGVGYLIAAPSPDGRRAALLRLKDHRLALGVVTLADRHVRWFDIAPDLPLARPMPVWIDSAHLLVSTFVKPQLPWMLLFGNAYQRGVAERWRAQRRGLRPTGSVTSDSDETALAQRPLNRLERIDVRTGARVTLLDHTAIYDVAVSGDHRRLAVLTVGEAVTPPADLPIAVDYVDRRHRLLIGMLGDRPPAWRRLNGDFLPDLLAWSPDDSSLLAYRRSDRAAWQQGQLVRIAAADATLHGLGVIEPPARRALRSQTPDVHAFWLGRDIIARVTDAAGTTRWRVLSDHGRRLLIRGDDGVLTHLADGTAAYRLSGRQLTVLDTAGRWRSLGGDVVSLGVAADDGRQGSRAAADAAYDAAPAVVTANGPRSRVRLAADRAAQLDLPAAARSTVLAVSLQRHAALVLSTARSGVGTLYVLRQGRSPRAIDTINAGLAAVDQPHMIRLTARASDGRAYADWLLLPPHRRHGARPPLVVMPYPGETYDALRPGSFDPETLAPTNSAPLLAGQGYAVLLPSIPYVAASNPDPHAIVDDIGAAVDAAVASGHVDPRRIALYGHSYGGYGALVVASSTTRYCGIVAANAPSNFISSYGVPPPGDRLGLDQSSIYAGQIGMTEAGQDGMMAPPWRNPARYLNHSPFFSLDRIHTPLLLVSGDLDYVPMAQSESLYSSLVRLGRPVTLVRYWGEGHVIASPANIADQYRRIFTWLDARFAARRCR